MNRLITSLLYTSCEDFLYNKRWSTLTPTFSPFPKSIPKKTATLIQNSVKQITSVLKTRVITDNLHLKFTPSNDCEPDEFVALNFASIQRDKCDRPTAGEIFVCPRTLKIVDTSFVERSKCQVAIYEIMKRLLFFDLSHYPLFRYPSGKARTRRGRSGKPVKSMQCSPTKGWTSRSGLDTRDDLTGVVDIEGTCERADLCEFLVVTDQVRVAARKLGLKTQGAALILKRGNEGCFVGQGAWQTENTNSGFSPLTVALVRDSGWYEVDQAKVDAFDKGHGEIEESV
jgi:hypothetical protein